MLGATSEIDRLFRENMELIEGVASLVHKSHPIKLEKFYRGILLTEEEANGLKLKPIKKLTTLSFSTERQIALDFAYPHPDIAMMYRARGREVKGYMIEHTPKREHILFHWDWIKPMKIDQLFMEAYGENDLLYEQKEVVVKQTNKWFDLIPVNWDNEKDIKEAAPRIF